MAQILQATPYVHTFWMVLSDGKTPAPGKTVTVLISKAGGTFREPSGGADSAWEIGFGKYAIQLLPADTAVLGDLNYHYDAPGCADSDDKDQVIPAPAVDVQHGDNQTIIAILGQLVVLSQQLVDGLTPPG